MEYGIYKYVFNGVKFIVIASVCFVCKIIVFRKLIIGKIFFLYLRRTTMVTLKGTHLTEQARIEQCLTNIMQLTPRSVCVIVCVVINTNRGIGAVEA